MKRSAQQISAVALPSRWPVLCTSFALCVTLGASHAFAEEGFTAAQNGCKVANPTPKPNETVRWNGPCVDGYADGKGVMQWYVGGEPSTRYEGTVHHGQLSGRGKLTMSNGASYEGDWLAGKQDGTGVQAMPDGNRYQGEWKNGQPDGRGVMRNAAGETFDGEWKEGAYVGPAEKK